jgi:hypothetical protein
MESPAFSDPRQQDVSAVREILDVVGASGKEAKLPVMATAELAALGALADDPLIDAHALEWWISQPDQETLARQAYDHLAQRKLIDPATGRVHPQLGLILAGRGRPAFILICRERPDAEPNMMHLFGIADETAGLRAVLIEGVLPMQLKWAGPAYDYVLSSAPKVSRDLAKWAAERKHRTLDIYLPGSGTNLPSHRFVVAPALRRLHVERATPTTAAQRVTCSEEELAGLLLNAMTGASR